MKGIRPPLEIQDWGRLGYAEAIDRQLVLVADRVADRSVDRLILVEHPPVVTLGRSGGLEDLKKEASHLQAAGIEVRTSDRGGQATFHGPGQLVAYPILKLISKDLHAFLDNLLQTAAEVLRDFGLNPERKKGQPGLWVDGAKIASVGLAARRWVTYHGLALNVNTDLEGFDFIIPCGRPEEQVTSMRQALGRILDLDEIKLVFVKTFRRRFGFSMTDSLLPSMSKHPPWLIGRAPDPVVIQNMADRLDRLGLATVCQSAHCPNQGECFRHGTATFMILGKNCTRRCRFCGVDKNPTSPPDPGEPDRVSQAAQELGLNHVVVTSVTRDDLLDGGAGHFSATIRQIKTRLPFATVEVLTPDFLGSVRALETVLTAAPDVFNHNLETVPRLYRTIRPGADYRRSLGVLAHATNFGVPVKSGLMLGLGETSAEIKKTLMDLRRTGCRLVTLGQYLAPSALHAPVKRFVSPEEFQDWAEKAKGMGFEGVAAGPLVRSSYRAEEMLTSSFKKNMGGIRG